MSDRRSRSFSNDLIEVSVPLGRLVYMGSASSGTELRFDEKKGWVQSGNKRQPFGRLNLNPLAALQRCMEWSRQRPIALALLSLVLGGGMASGAFLLKSGTPSDVAAVSLLPPPVAEEAVTAEELEAVDYSYAQLSGAAASAVALPVAPAAVPAAPVPVPPSVPAVAPAAAPVPAVAPAKPAPRPAAAAPAAPKEPSTAPVFDAGPHSAAAAPAVVPPKPERRAAAEAPRSGKLLLAVPSKDWVVVADAASGLPKQYRVGDRLPTGAVILSADPKAGTVVTDRGPLNLE